MKNLKQITNDFLTDVKWELDNANWSYQYCNSHIRLKDIQKAIDFLSTQKFSQDIIKYTLKEEWTEIVKEIQNIQIRKDKAKFVAEWIADTIAQARIARYTATGWLKDGYYSKKWWIDETVSFHIN